MKKQLKASQQSIKEANLKLIFNTLLKNQPITRAGLKKLTKLSATTVTFLTEELIGKGFIEEKGVPETDEVGRKGILLAVKRNGAYFAGLEITNTSVKCDVYDLSFTAVFSSEKSYVQPKELTEAVVAHIDNSLKVYGQKLMGVAIGIPALIDNEQQNIITSTVLSVQTEGGLIKFLKEKYGDLYITLFNSSGFVAYAEKESREDEDINTLFSVDINEGVGSGLIIGGKLYTGTCGHSGEFGHITIDYKGEKCHCGSRGCLEGLINVNAVLNNMAKAKGVNSLSALEAEKLIKQKDRDALNIVRNAATILAYGINNIINLIEPDVIVISGLIKILGEEFLNAIKKELKALSLTNKETLIEYSKIEGNGVTLGGACYAFRKLFS